MHIFNRARWWLLALSIFAMAIAADAAADLTGSPRDGTQIPGLNWTPRSDWIDVRSAGAKGDGTTDDTDAIQSVLNRLSDKPADKQPQRHVVYFPPGRYRITRTLTVTESTGG